jgi:hypothetical protein
MTSNESREFAVIDHAQETDCGSGAAIVRPVDAFERLFYRYGERNPVHFSIVAEFDVVLGERQVRSALDAVQKRHPLLSVHVQDCPSTRLGFYRAPTATPVPLHVHKQPDLEWQSLATAELCRPFDRSIAPLMRAVLLTTPSTSAVLLTFDHTVADGISSVIVLNDLIAALNGESLAIRPVPPSQEAMLNRAFTDADQRGIAEQAEAEPRMLKPTYVRPFDGTPPQIHTVEMTAADTARLVDRCRNEQTTVHAAIVTAASRVRGQHHGEDYVRVLSNINFRQLIEAGPDCADYFSNAVTGMAPWDGTSFWDQARTMSAHLTVARSAPGILASSLAVQQAINVDADSAAAERFMTAGVPFDLLISNLGVQNLEVTGPIRPTALWAPVMETQIAGDFMIGVITYQGVLRMLVSGYTPTTEFLDRVASMLVGTTR